MDRNSTARIGLQVTRALNNLERGEEGEVDVDPGDGQIRIVNDPINGRGVIFELLSLF